MKKKLFALVQWVGGVFDKTYAAGVPVNRIFDLDPKTFKPENDDDDVETYVIEWRDDTETPDSWKYYDARVIQISSTQDIMRTLLKLRKEPKEVKDIMNVQRNQGIQNENPDQQVEIGHEGSQIFVTRAQWETANSRETYQKMAVSLVNCLFDKEVLLASNLRGGKSKIDKNALQKPGLDAIIISAITEAVKKKFPTDYKKAYFGMAINNYLTDLRRQNGVPAEEPIPLP